MLIFGFKNAFRRKITLIVAIIGTGLGVGLMTSLLSLSAGMEKRLEETTNKVAGDITITAADAPLGGIAGSYFGGGTPLPVEYVDIIRSIDHIATAFPVVSANIPSKSFKTPGPIGTSLSGVFLEDSSASKNVIEGRAYSSDYEVIIGKELALRYRIANDEPIQIGMRIEVPLIKFPSVPSLVQGDQDIILNDLRLGTSPTPIPPTGTNPSNQQIVQPNLNPTVYEVTTTSTPIVSPTPTPEIIQLTIVGLYETGSPLTDGFFYSNPSTARKLAQISENVASSFIARVDNVEYVETAAEMIRTSLADAEIPVSVSIAKDALGDLNEMLDIFDTFLLAIAVVASVAGGMSIFIIMLMNVNERLKEFGIFKAAGWSNWNIISSVVVEAVTVSLLGSGAGFIAGYSATRLIDMYIGQDIAVITPQLIVGVLSFGIIMGVVGGLYPASNAARVSPMETIRGD